MSDAKKKEGISPERLELSSVNIVNEQILKLKELFPESVTEGNKIDLDALRRTLGEAVEEGKERYGLMWAGKSDCFRTIQRPSTGTLLPLEQRSINFESSGNVIIEGDNLEVLKLLQKSYLGKIKMIYIDPPYNTGNDFIYPDDFSETLDTYLKYTGQVDTEGRRFSNNLDTDGRFHSKWLNMMYPRLFLARNLLRDDGVIFISIDDHEIDNLKKICSEIFGEQNFLACVCWQKKYAPSNDTVDFSATHDFILVYARERTFIDGSKALAVLNRMERTAEQNKLYKNPDHDPRGLWMSGDYTCNKSAEQRPNLYYPLIHPKTGKEIFPSRAAVWRYSRERHEMNEKDGRVWWGLNHENETPRFKRFLSEVSGVVANTWWEYEDVGHNDEAKKQLKELFPEGNNSFDTPKPVRLLNRMVQLGTSKDDESIVLDFFAGSGTTGHAVLDANLQDGGNRKFILVQLPEPVQNDSASTISDICEERIRRVIKNHQKEEEKKSQALLFDGKMNRLDDGFRAFKLSSSNFKPWVTNASSTPGDLTRQLPLHISNLQEGRRQEDILFELLLKAGFELSSKVEKIETRSGPLLAVHERALLVCLESAITKELINDMANLNPARVICLDTSFAGNDQLKVNAVEIFKAKGITFRTV